MDFRITNAQRTDPVNTTQIRRLASHAARHLAIRTRGRIEITFLDARRIQALNKRFLRHDRMTDVLSFRYDPRYDPSTHPALRGGVRSGRRPPLVVGEILVAPSAALTYARRHGVQYEEKNVAVDEEARNMMVEKSGQLGVPVIEIDNAIVIGYNKAKLSELLKINE